MDTLFPPDAFTPQGFSYRDHFITEGEEEKLVTFISTLNLHPFLFHGFEAKRKVESFGFDYHFGKRNISTGKPIPEAFIFLIERVSLYTGIPAFEFSELLVTYYPRGSVINWHRDAPPFDIVVGISLRSDCTFKLRPYQKDKPGRTSVISIPVKRRSVYVISSAARNEWEHSISPVRFERYSITLRTLRK